jgi:hypothetical protein
MHNSGADDEYLLGFVEIDDQGQLRDRKQMQALLDALWQIPAEEGLLINVFVHGWHHNADPDDDNIAGFRNNLLAKLSEIESKHSKPLKHKRRKVVGVYVGWRGESIDWPPFNYLTFWDRKSTAQDVGYLGATELLAKLEEITNIRNSLYSRPANKECETEQETAINKIDPAAPGKSRLVVLGHSFGGAVVFSATSQILADRFVDSQEGKSCITSAKGFGDLVVLLNPAFEALRYAPFYDLAQSRCSSFSDQTPKLAILTSVADDATGMLFPLGRTFSTFFETHDNDIVRNDCKKLPPLTLDEGEADRNTVGHYLPLISHTLKLPEQEKELRVLGEENMKNFWSGQIAGGSTRFGATVLTHLNKTIPSNPYLNIRVDKDIISDHNDVLNDKVMEFVRLLIEMSTAD